MKEDKRKIPYVKEKPYYPRVSKSKFRLCHLGEKVKELTSKYPNDTDLGKEIRKLAQKAKDV
jgi:hypothetical protein